jgi:hypothetical protein
MLEEKLGRPLLPGEVTHHKNAVKKDNRPENLEVVTRSAHAKAHFPQGPWVGKKHSEETRKKIAAALVGRPLSPQTCLKMSMARTGKKWGAESVRRQKQAAIMAERSPRRPVAQEEAEALRTTGLKWREVALALGVSYATLRRRRKEWGC